MPEAIEIVASGAVAGSADKHLPSSWQIGSSSSLAQLRSKEAFELVLDGFGSRLLYDPMFAAGMDDVWGECLLSSLRALAGGPRDTRGAMRRKWQFYADGKYAGRQIRPNPQWLHGGGVPLLNDVTLSEIIWSVDDATVTKWNSLLINLYENGSDYQRWHSGEKVWNRRRTDGHCGVLFLPELDVDQMRAVSIRHESIVKALVEMNVTQ